MLSKEHQKLHQTVLQARDHYRKAEWRLVEVLMEVERNRLHIAMGVTSLFQYCVRFLDLSEAVTYNLIAVTKQAARVPALKSALAEGKLSVSKAAKMVSVIDGKNARQWVEFASSATYREVERRVAEVRPEGSNPDKVKILSHDRMEITVSMSKEEYRFLVRARELLAQKSARNASLGTVIGAAAKVYVEKHDPVAKAERAKGRVSEQQLFARRVKEDKSLNLAENNKLDGRGTGAKRKALTAEQEHAVNLRDQGRCTYRDINGNRCTNERWLQIHHIKPVSEGGTNDPDNLTTLCWTHHDLVHQLSLPIEGQVTWLREPAVEYSAI